MRSLAGCSVTTLLDANVLVALVVVDHLHYDAAEKGFVDSDDNFAICPSTEGSLLRLLSAKGRPRSMPKPSSTR
jgi:predicted nucleic acid-binding protein